MNKRRDPSYTKRQIADWRAFEKVRASGRWNIWDEHALRASGLRREDYLFALKNYSDLKRIVEQEKAS